MDRAPDASEPGPGVALGDAPAVSAAERRPPGVPGHAGWLPDRELWEQAATGATGDKDGAATQWRPDGTLYMRAGYKQGRLDGPFTIYHPDGQVAREGNYVEGNLDGPMVSHATDGPTPERLRSCCVPDNAWQMKSRFERGELQVETFYDRQGRELLSDGTLRPDRPPALPATVALDQYNRRWTLGARDDRGCCVGPWRSWTIEGVLDEEAEYHDTRKLWSRRYDGEGAVREEVHFEGDGVRHGPYRRRLLPGEEGPWADRRIREERGAFEHGQTVGAWTFLDGTGAVVRAVDHGPAHDDQHRMAALVDEDGTAAHWLALSRSLRAQGSVREALCAAARAAACSGSTAELSTLLAEVTVPPSAEANDRALAGLAAGPMTVARALDALVAGVTAASVLRTLASVVEGTTRAARDLIEAAILLAPEQRMAYMTRALIRIELGDLEGAKADAERVAPESPEAADFLRSYLRVLFPTFSFWPAREVPVSPLEGIPDAPAQPLAAVRRAIQVYATRLGRLRAALVGKVGGTPAWLPAEVTELVPDGPVELRKETAQIVDQTDDGSEITEVKIDESLDVAALGVPALLRMVRMHWAALGWLCWSAGLDRVALPDALLPPANFDQAAGMIIARYFRAQDGVVTGGLRSMTAGVRGFSWEGMDVDGLPGPLNELLLDEYLEMRAVFLFLASPENLSPFQSDLRQT
jgi:antitoxin component YwqK of YwqJK toxin-antitoxin module